MWDQWSWSGSWWRASNVTERRGPSIRYPAPRGSGAHRLGGLRPRHPRRRRSVERAAALRPLRPHRRQRRRSGRRRGPNRLAGSVEVVQASEPRPEVPAIALMRPDGYPAWASDASGSGAAQIVAGHSLRCWSSRHDMRRRRGPRHRQGLTAAVLRPAAGRPPRAPGVEPGDERCPAPRAARWRPRICQAASPAGVPVADPT